jgi:hypothetical protein
MEMAAAEITHLSLKQLESGLDHIKNSPKNEGVLEMIVVRPDVDQREVLNEGELSIHEGLQGDNWLRRGSGRTHDGSAHPDMQLNIMNSRVIDLVSQDRSRWSLAGDQLYIDLDLSDQNLPAGTRLKIGKAIVEVTDQEHMGCKKFMQRFGLAAMQFVNSDEGRKLHLRGINAKVITEGRIHTGDKVIKL